MVLRRLFFAGRSGSVCGGVLRGSCTATVVVYFSNGFPTAGPSPACGVHYDGMVVEQI